MSPHGNLALKPTKTTINAFENGKIIPIGKTIFKVVYKGNCYNIDCEVIDGDVPNLLGGDSSRMLGLVKKVNAVSASTHIKHKINTNSSHKLPPGPVIPVKIDLISHQRQLVSIQLVCVKCLVKPKLVPVQQYKMVNTL